MVKKKLQQVTNITNNGINNGIMANTVIVPSDKEIPLVDNFIIEEVTDTAFLNLYKKKIIFEIKPKQGLWYSPIIAFPSKEDSLVQGMMTLKK
ncbi:MAG: hypothetical protein WKG06_45320 [Segetibacter sp.]